MPPPSTLPTGWNPTQLVVVKKSRGCLTAFIVVGGVLVLLFIGLMVLALLSWGFAAEKVNDATRVADASDYTIDIKTCTPDPASRPRSTGTILNSSDKAQGFAVTIRFTSSQNVLIAEETAFVRSLEIGQSGEWTLAPLIQTNSEVTCSLKRVNYTIFD